MPRVANDNPPERLWHLVQEDDQIRKIHEEEIPPDLYYEALALELGRLFPNASVAFLAHIVAVAVAFETAAAFALSFGIKNSNWLSMKLNLKESWSVGKVAEPILPYALPSEGGLPS